MTNNNNNFYEAPVAINMSNLIPTHTYETERGILEGRFPGDNNPLEPQQGQLIQTVNYPILVNMVGDDEISKRLPKFNRPEAKFVVLNGELFLSAQQIATTLTRHPEMPFFDGSIETIVTPLNQKGFEQMFGNGLLAIVDRLITTRESGVMSITDFTKSMAKINLNRL